VTAVLDAPPLMVFAAARTCLISNVAIELAAIDTVVANATSSKDKVNVYADEPVLDTTMFVIIAVVDAGTVYRVVDVVVVAAPRKSALEVTAIINCLS